jgi:GDP-mannose 6-dehydrogenase
MATRAGSKNNITNMSDQKSSRTPIPVSVFGLGYVGAVMSACLARLGHRVMGVDVNRLKVDLLNSGQSPIREPEMEDLVSQGHNSCHLHATLSAAEAIEDTEVSFLCVGTPSLRNGGLDLSGLERAAEQIGLALARKQKTHTIAVRSTVLPGSIDTVIIPALERTSGKRAGVDFFVCSNPEFMREGSAINDFFHPPFTVLGARDPAHLAPLREMYSQLPGKLFETSLRSAEMVKYVCNTFHALKVDFANEIGTLCKALGVPSDEVINIFCADTKLNISPAYLKPGFAFGGSCLPKDVKALTYRAKQLDLQLPLLNAIMPSNQAHIEQAVERILSEGKRKIGCLGLSFKSGTDDLRESPLLHVVKRLLGEGCEVQIYDRNVSWSCVYGANKQFAESEIPHIASLLRPTLEEVVRNAELIVIGNSDSEYAGIGEWLKKDQIVLDFARVPNLPAQAQGLCW